MKRGDWIVYYSGREDWTTKVACQRFTGIGRIVGSEIYAVEMREGFRPFRRDVIFCSGREAAIRPLIPELTFIRDKKHWGFPFRRGYQEISASDFGRIAEAMLEGPFQPEMQCPPAERLGNAPRD